MTGLFPELGVLFRVLLGFQGSKQEALEKLSEKIGRKFLQIAAEKPQKCGG